MDFERRSIARDGGLNVRKPRKDLVHLLALADRSLNSVDIALTHVHWLPRYVSLHRKKTAQECPGAVPLAPAWLEQLLDLIELLVYQDVDIRHGLRRDRKHSLGQMIRKTITEHVVQNLVEQCQRCASVDVQKTLVQFGQPVLLVVSQAVDGAEKTTLLRTESKVLTGEVQAALEPDGPAGPLVEHLDALLSQRRLEQHFEGVLQVQQYGGLATVVIKVVEGHDRTAQRVERFQLEKTGVSAHATDGTWPLGWQSTSYSWHHFQGCA